MKDKLSKILKDKFYRQGLLVVLLSQVGSLFHFLYQLLMSHELTKQEFGLLNALLAFAMILLVPMATLQMVVSRYVSEYKANGDTEKLKKFFSMTFRNLIFISLALVCLFWLFQNPLSAYLHAENDAVFMWLALFVIACMFNTFGLGVLQGLQRFFLLGACLFLGGFLKWGGGYLLKGQSADLETIVMMLAFAGAFVFIPMAFVTRKLWTWPFSKQTRTKEVVSYALPSFATYGLLSIILSMDLVLIQHFLGKTSSQAGLYATAAVLGKTILYASLSVIMVMFPKVTESHLKTQDSFSYLLKSLGFALFISGGALSIFLVFPETVLVFFGKREALAAVSYLRLYSVAMLLMVLIHLFVNYFVAIQRFTFLKTLSVILVLEYTIIYQFHNSLHQVLVLFNGVLILGLVGMLIHFFRVKGGAVLNPKIISQLE